MAKSQFNSPLASRSSHDLGYQFIGSSDFGRITPFFCKELIPTDHFSIRTSAFVRMLPLVVPTFGQADLQLHFAFVPSRMLCDGFNDILTGKGKYALSMLPYADANSFKLLANGMSSSVDSLTGHSPKHDFFCQLSGFGLPNPQYFTSDMPNISLLPFRAYQRFWWDFFRDPELIPDSDIDNYLTTTPGKDTLVFQRSEKYMTRYRTFRSTWLSSLYRNSGAEDTQTEIADLQTRLRVSVNELGGLLQLASSDEDSAIWTAPAFNDLSTVILGKDGLVHGSEGDLSYVAANQSVSARGQRVAEACTRLRERCNAAQKRVIDQIEAIYGKISQWLVLNRVQYLGGSSTPIQISDVTSTADTFGTDTGASLGAQAGKGIAASRGDKIEYTADEHGYIIGVYSIMPRQNFCQGIPKEFVRVKASDIFTKDFEHLGFMPVQKCEVYVPETKNPSGYSVNGVFGYTEPYYEYKRSLDILQGDMRKYSLQDGDINKGGIYSSYNLYRLINPSIQDGAVIDFNQAFFSVGNLQFNRIFEFGGNQSTDQDHFFLNLDVKCIANRPMDGFAVPTLETQEQPHAKTTTIKTRE